MKRQQIKLWGGMALFSIAGLIGTVIGVNSDVVAPDLAFYVVLLCNTYPSIKLFSKIEPNDTPQFIVDTLLTIAYVGAGLSIGGPRLFPLFVMCLFIVAPFKYALMLKDVPHPKFLMRKIKIDLSGTTMSVGVFVIALLGHPLLAAWLLAAIFTAANIYHLLINPQYRLPND